MTAISFLFLCIHELITQSRVMASALAELVGVEQEAAAELVAVAGSVESAVALHFVLVRDDLTVDGLVSKFLGSIEELGCQCTRARAIGVLKRSEFDTEKAVDLYLNEFLSLSDRYVFVCSLCS